MRNVTILGGGYAGLRVARLLSGTLDHRWTITLIDRGECHQLITRLPEVVAAKISPRAACLPFARLLAPRVRFIRSDATSVDLSQRIVDTSDGVLQPDILVIAVGNAADFLGVPGAAEHTTTLKSVRDARHIRNTVATLRSRQSIVRVVVVGAGYTGSEVAGELSALQLQRTLGETRGRIDVRLIAEDRRLLPQANRRLGAAVERVLRARGLPLHLGQPVHSVRASGLTVADGTEYPADLIFWAAQSRVALHVPDPDRYQGPGEKLRTDPYLQAAGSENVFACGDAALVIDYERQSVAASSAQLALQEADVVAYNINALIAGTRMREYRPHVLGEALGLGGSDAVAEVGGLLFTGRAAAAVKRAALVRYLGTLGMRDQA